jgi:hypothetical protein
MPDRIVKVAPLTLASMLAVPVAQAQWTGKGEAGSLLASGNSDTKNKECCD